MKKAKPDPLADARLAAVLESISDVYYAVDRDWRITLFNRSAEEFFGVPRARIVGRGLWELFPAGKTSEFGRLLRQVMEDRQPGRLTTPSALRSGRTVEIRIAPLGDEGVGVSVTDITVRGEAERAMRRSQQRLDLAVEAHGIGIFDWHIPSGQMVWSPELEAIYGLEPGGFEGHIDDSRKRVLPEDLAGIESRIRAAIAAAQDVLKIAFRIRRADGAIRWLEGRARLVYNAEGAPERMVGTNVDVTERVLAEQAIRQNQERLDLAVGAHRIGIFDWHVPSGRLVWSPELEAIFGLAPGTFEGSLEAYERRVLPEDLPRAKAETEAAVAAGQDLIGFNFRIRREDGAIRWIEGMARVVFLPDGTPERIVGTNVDVTERVEAEQAIEASRERLDLAVGAHAIGIFDWHVPSGRATWSGEMEEIFGVQRGTFEGHTDAYRRRVLPDDLARIWAETEAALAAGVNPMQYEFRILRDDGTIRWIEGAARFVFGPDGGLERVVGTNIDITDRKAAEQHQRLLINELNHRVKNTLAIVQAIAWQSFRASGAPPGAVESFEGRLSALAAAHDVLTRHSWEAASIGSIVAGAVAPHDPGGGRLAVQGPAVDLEPKTAVALGLAMHELATNAVKYGALSTPAGRVDVRWTVDGARLRLTWRESGGPSVTQPSRRGFGARLLERGLAGELHGAVRLEFPPQGVVCFVEASLSDQ